MCFILVSETFFQSTFMDDLADAEVHDDVNEMNYDEVED